MGTRTAQLQLHLDLEAEPIAGWLAIGDGEPLAFIGYTGLIAALESIRAGERQELPS